MRSLLCVLVVLVATRRLLASAPEGFQSSYSLELENVEGFSGELQLVWSDEDSAWLGESPSGAVLAALHSDGGVLVQTSGAGARWLGTAAFTGGNSSLGSLSGSGDPTWTGAGYGGVGLPSVNLLASSDGAVAGGVVTSVLGNALPVVILLVFGCVAMRSVMQAVKRGVRQVS